MTSICVPSFKKRYALVIPAYNEEHAISEVVAGVSIHGTPIVVDDGSNDNTALLAERAGAIVIKHAFNRGYDAALETGIFEAIKLGFIYAITLDADGQHFPQTVVAFKVELDQGADLVIGVRDRHQRFSETIFSRVGTFLWGIKDPLCGMKGYKLDHLSNLGFFSSYKSVGTEFAIRCARSGLVIRNVPVPTRPRVGQSRFGSGLSSDGKILRALVIGLISATSFKK